MDQMCRGVLNMGDKAISKMLVKRNQYMSYADTHDVCDEEPCWSIQDGYIKAIWKDSHIAEHLIKEIENDVVELLALMDDTKLNQACRKRLTDNQELYKSFCKNNQRREYNENLFHIMKNSSRGSNIRVDSHCHTSAVAVKTEILTALKQLIEEISPDVYVYIDKKGNSSSFNEIFVELGLDIKHFIANPLLYVNLMNMTVDEEDFKNFALFSKRFNPFGSKKLHKIMLSYDNVINGRGLTLILSIVNERLKANKEFAEPKVTVTGYVANEWYALAKWWNDNKINNLSNIKLGIQILKSIGKKATQENGQTFHQQMYNFFSPLVEVTLDPKKHRELNEMLKNVSDFDAVDDESYKEEIFSKNFKATDLRVGFNPNTISMIATIFHNFTILNILQRSSFSEGMKFIFQPHLGEMGNENHLAIALLCCPGIKHGGNLHKNWFLEYFSYISQMVLHMALISNSYLCVSGEENPSRQFLDVGIPITLNTDDAAIFHRQFPLQEEYDFFRIVKKATQEELAELTLNSLKYCTIQKVKQNIPKLINCRQRFRECLLTQHLNVLTNSISKENFAWNFDKNNTNILNNTLLLLSNIKDKLGARSTAKFKRKNACSNFLLALNQIQHRKKKINVSRLMAQLKDGIDMSKFFDPVHLSVNLVEYIYPINMANKYRKMYHTEVTFVPAITCHEKSCNSRKLYFPCLKLSVLQVKNLESSIQHDEKCSCGIRMGIGQLKPNELMLLESLKNDDETEIPMHINVNGFYDLVVVFQEEAEKIFSSVCNLASYFCERYVHSGDQFKKRMNLALYRKRERQ